MEVCDKRRPLFNSSPNLGNSLLEVLCVVADAMRRIRSEHSFTPVVVPYIYLKPPCHLLSGGDGGGLDG